MMQEEKTIFFVGIHNKPHLPPLCSSTLSGKRIDAIISRMPTTCVKTNLYDLEYIPKGHTATEQELCWFERHRPQEGDIIVLLGNIVHYSFPVQVAPSCKVIKLAHPSLQYSKVRPLEYIDNAVTEITKAL